MRRASAAPGSNERLEHREEIRHGLAWIERMARDDDTVAALLAAEPP